MLLTAVWFHRQVRAYVRNLGGNKKDLDKAGEEELATTMGTIMKQEDRDNDGVISFDEFTGPKGLNKDVTDQKGETGEQGGEQEGSDGESPAQAGDKDLAGEMDSEGVKEDSEGEKSEKEELWDNQRLYIAVRGMIFGGG